MPAQEDYYRPQKTLHIVFAVTSVLMLFSILWMIARDHMREWRSLQREFMKLEAAKIKHEDAKDYRATLNDLYGQLEEAEGQVATDVAELGAELPSVLGRVQAAEQELAFTKANRDSIASLYTIAIGHGPDYAEEAAEHKVELDRLDVLLVTNREVFERTTVELEAIQTQIDKANAAVTSAKKKIAEAEKELGKLEAKEWSFAKTMRSLPILDAFAPATKIQQVALDDLTINYSFGDVGRFDRCVTCHMAIDAVTSEGGPAFSPELVEELCEQNDIDPKYRNAFKTHPRSDLFASATSPHNKEKFGCTICHEGQGSGTSFTNASHSGNTLAQVESWEDEYHFHEVHHWPYKMLRSRFVESSCLKCHVHVVDLEESEFGNTAPKVTRGYHIIRQYGCFGCHEINGYLEGKQVGPDMRLEPQTPEEWAAAGPDNPAGTMRKVGPSLRRVSEKTNVDFLSRWILKPSAFRPSTRMPQFYHLTNNNGDTTLGSEESDPLRAKIEAKAMALVLNKLSVEYLDQVQTVLGMSDEDFSKLTGRRDALLAKEEAGEKLTSDESKELVAVNREIALRKVLLLEDPPVAIDASNDEQTVRGKSLFSQKGCLACHTHKDVKGEGADADFGPDLSEVSTKLNDGTAKTTKWLFHWIRDPNIHNPRTRMPDTQLADQEVADIAAWLMSVDGAWAEDVPAPTVDNVILNEMIRLYLDKAMTLDDARIGIEEGFTEEMLSNLKGDEKVLSAPISEDKKLEYIGRKSISRLGCFGCHDIPGYETSKSIGTTLADWGMKARLDPDKLAFEHVVEFLSTHMSGDFGSEKEEADFELYLEGMKHHKGESFIWQKLRRPRSYDYKMLRKWDERLRMPRFPFADDPEAVEAVMTFVLGLLADPSIPPSYRHFPTGAKKAKVEGAKLVTQFNCAGCHVMEMPNFVIDKAQFDLSTPDYTKDFPELIKFHSDRAQDASIGGDKFAVHGMLIDVNEELPMLQVPKELDEEAVFYLELWKSTKIDGDLYMPPEQFVFQEEETLKALDLTLSKPAVGGRFAEYLVQNLPKIPNKSRRDLWFRVPPPLAGEGAKVRADWLHQFLLNPIAIRPGVVLRMPKFNMTSKEAATFAAYFAARAGIQYPHEYSRETDDSYLARQEQRVPDYLTKSWDLLTVQVKEGGGGTQLCASCHNVGSLTPKLDPLANGPDLWLAKERLRPEWLQQWLANPARTTPYTGMPTNFPPGSKDFGEYIPGTSFDRLTAVRDALVNYHRIQQQKMSQKQVSDTNSANSSEGNTND